jgi:hypothetical protein
MNLKASTTQPLSIASDRVSAIATDACPPVVHLRLTAENRESRARWVTLKSPVEILVSFY